MLKLNVSTEIICQNGNYLNKMRGGACACSLHLRGMQYCCVLRRRPLLLWSGTSALPAASYHLMKYNPSEDQWTLGTVDRTPAPSCWFWLFRTALQFWLDCKCELPCNLSFSHWIRKHTLQRDIPVFLFLLQLCHWCQCTWSSYTDFS